MKYYPLYHNLQGKTVLLVGGGNIGLQKLPALLECEAKVHLVAPEILPEIEAMLATHTETLKWDKREYETVDLQGVVFVIAATDNPALQQRIAGEARARNLWVNIVDVPALCDFIAPALVSRGKIQIAISTGGAAPALAKFIRKKLETIIGDEYVQFAEIAQRLRPQIMKLPKPKRLALWDSIVNDKFLNDIKTFGPAKAEDNIKEWIHGNNSL